MPLLRAHSGKALQSFLVGRVDGAGASKGLGLGSVDAAVLASVLSHPTGLGAEISSPLAQQKAAAAVLTARIPYSTLRQAFGGQTSTGGGGGSCLSSLAYCVVLTCVVRCTCTHTCVYWW